MWLARGIAYVLACYSSSSIIKYKLIRDILKVLPFIIPTHFI
jgi:hypothetical protein